MKKRLKLLFFFQNPISTPQRLEITIRNIALTQFYWQIPSFPVITLLLKKVTFDLNSKLTNGVINSTQLLKPGLAVCTAHCDI